MTQNAKKPKETRRRRAVRSVPSGTQPDLFVGVSSFGTPEWRRKRDTGFVDNDPEKITIGNQLLSTYLRNSKQEWIFVVREVIRSVDYAPFLQRYSRKGRAPYAPAAMLGLYLYGTMNGTDSLRSLEQLARLDLGAIYVCGGICPDHSSIGRFVHDHADLLAESFFENLTAAIFKRLGSSARLLAGDGSVFHAAASRRSTIKREAAELAAREAREAAQAEPSDEAAAERATKAEAVAAAANERAAARARAGKSVQSTQACTTDPEAAVLKDKRGQFLPAAHGSVLVNDQQLIVGQHVAPTCELTSVEPMFEQARRIAPDAGAEAVLLDGGYACGPVLDWAVENDVNLLAPVKEPAAPARTNGTDGGARVSTNGGAASADAGDSNEERAAGDAREASGQKKPKTYTKAEFFYDSKEDHYVCPAGQFLKRSGKGEDKRRGEQYDVYSASRRSCRACPLLDQCLGNSKEKRRRLNRYSSDETCEALRQVMAQPRARSLWDKRKVMAEPVFAEFRGAQRFNRFRRFGLRGERAEFALHACAHNLRRLVRLAAKAAEAAAATASQARVMLLVALYAAFCALRPRLAGRTATQCVRAAHTW